MQPLQNCIGPTIRIGRESWCLPYAEFLFLLLRVSWVSWARGVGRLSFMNRPILPPHSQYEFVENLQKSWKHSKSMLFIKQSLKCLPRH